MNNRLINTKVAGGGGGCTDIVDNYDPFGGNGVALYQLNGNANDVSGNYNGTATAVTYGTGQFGQAGVFNGSSSNIDYPLLNGFLNTRTTVSVSLWFKCGTQSEPATVFSDYANQSMNVDFYIGTDGKINGTTRYGGNSLYMTPSSNSYDDNSWHHIVVVVDQNSNTRKHYVDGVEINSGTLPSGSWNGDSNQKVLSGAIFYTINSTYLNKFNGSIDQVRIFNTALDPLEVEALYTEELCICDGTVDTLDILGDGSCIATYQLDGNANDLSGNYSGTPANISYGVGEFDLAGVFNGSSSYIDTLITNSAIPTNSDFTISAWVNSRDVSTTNEIVVQGNNCCWNLVSFAFDIRTNGALAIAFSNNSGGTGVLAASSTGVIQENIWYHVVGIVDIGNQISLYVNGSNVNNTSINSNSRISVATPFRIGADSVSVGNFNGSIDQVRIFNKALNSTEVTTLYNETACTVQPVPYSDYSALFNGTDEYMERTPSAASNRQVFTISVWFNTSSSGTRKSIISQGIDGNTFFEFEVTSTGTINIDHILGGVQIGLNTTATYNDGQWHNIVLAVNTNLSQSTDRVKLYVDGDRVTSFSNGTYPSQGYNTLYNGTNKVTVGRISNCCLPYNGYLALLNSIDGLELDPTFFGEFNGSQWTPKGYAGSYGTNGFLLDFSNSSQLGEDLSGKNNNFSLVNMDSSNQFQNFNI